MSWPPPIGDPLPRADEAYGIEEKLAAYCLNPEHEIGGPKARAFQRILGVELADLDYLAGALQTGVLESPVIALRDNAPFGVLCEVPVSVAGLRKRRDHQVSVTTVWELRHPGDPPRLITAYIEG